MPTGDPNSVAVATPDDRRVGEGMTDAAAGTADDLAAIEQALDAATRWTADCPPRLAEAIRYSLLSGGKRLRPRLVLAGCRVVGGDAAQAMPAAVAVEMVHAYSLIHDDLPAMDDDDVRRGRPTCHLQYDEASAILAGDALLTEAFVQTAALAPASVAQAATRTLAAAAGAAGMVGGQMADLAAETTPVERADDLQRIHERKTGALIAASLRLGGLCGLAEPDDLTALVNYGRSVGLLFQITDDLLDACGDPVTMGKNARKDTDRGKATYPGLLGVERSQTLARELADEAVASLERFDRTADPLRDLARSLLDREK